MTDDLTISFGSERYVLRREGDGLQVGRSVGGDVAWLDTVDVGLLPPAAREALDRGDTSDGALLTALRGVLAAEAERGA